MYKSPVLDPYEKNAIKHGSGKAPPKPPPPPPPPPPPTPVLDPYEKNAIKHGSGKAPMPTPTPSPTPSPTPGSSWGPQPGSSWGPQPGSSWGPQPWLSANSAMINQQPSSVSSGADRLNTGMGNETGVGNTGFGTGTEQPFIGPWNTPSGQDPNAPQLKLVATSEDDQGNEIKIFKDNYGNYVDEGGNPIDMDPADKMALDQQTMYYSEQRDMGNGYYQVAIYDDYGQLTWSNPYKAEASSRDEGITYVPELGKFLDSAEFSAYQASGGNQQENQPFVPPDQQMWVGGEYQGKSVFGLAEAKGTGAFDWANPDDLEYINSGDPTQTRGGQEYAWDSSTGTYGTATGNITGTPLPEGLPPRYTDGDTTYVYNPMVNQGQGGYVVQSVDPNYISPANQAQLDLSRQTLDQRQSEWAYDHPALDVSSLGGAGILSRQAFDALPAQMKKAWMNAWDSGGQTPPPWYQYYRSGGSGGAPLASTNWVASRQY